MTEPGRRPATSSTGSSRCTTSSGSTWCSAISLAGGATVVLVQRFDPATALESIRARGVSVIPGAPAMWVAFAHFDEAPADAFAGVRLALSGAAKLPISVVRAARGALRAAHRRGLRADRGVAGRHVVGRRCRRVFGSVGRVLDGIELRIVDDDGGDALVGDAGEIWVRGPNVFAGYLDDPEATARVLTADGWLRTGDIGMCDEDGRLYLIDRAKDLVIVSGFNVYPAEVEDVLRRAPRRRRGRRDRRAPPAHRRGGQGVRRAGRRGDASTRTRSSTTAATTSPATSARAKILFVDELPRTATGKLLRRDLVVPGTRDRGPARTSDLGTL